MADLSRMHFDPSYLIDGARPSDQYIEHVEPPECGNVVRRGTRVRWCGWKGTMLRVRSAFVLPTLENIFYPSHIAGLVQRIDEVHDVIFDAPPARVLTVSAYDLHEQREAAAQGRGGLERFLRESWMTRPWARHDVGKRYVRLLNGNHRAFAAIYAGEPSIWVYVIDESRPLVQSELR